jgi:hypothetical protein
MRQSDFAVIEERAGIVFLWDLDQGGMSVTNDAERVYEWCQYYHGHGTSKGIRVVYRDSEGEWSEITKDPKTYDIKFLPWHGLDWDLLKR